MATEAVHRSLGLSDAEAEAISEVLGRDPTSVELAMYAVMWSEHCSYKSSRVHLGRLPSEGPGVLVGPGENAGVFDAGDGIAVALRIESHNHPSAIEPRQGAATGVGGIVRDIFAMGARPVALGDSLRFGDPLDERTRWIVDGVVSGISHYGNSVGVPTVAGEVVFDPSYAGNPLVNVACVGLLPKDRLMLARAEGVGNLAVLLGSSTGRDGIGGVSVLASAPFEGSGEEATAKRPSVQVGDPFEEKRLIEVCLELLDRRLVVALQDLGGAGLSCATSELASRGGVGMDVWVSEVPLREPGLEPLEVMTSESQERMLALVRPDDLTAVFEVARRFEVSAAVIGVVTGSERLRVLDRPEGAVLADVPARSLADGAPRYRRPLAPPEELEARRATDPAERLGAPSDAGEDLCALLMDTSWVWRQYDHQLFASTVVGPGGDATLLRLGGAGLPRTRRGLALTIDGNHRWCSLDPRRGVEWVVAEAAANVAVVGARPVVMVDCLNFGDPTSAEVMWQLSETVDGLAAASRELGTPVVGGNVSLYNRAGGKDIPPTPVVMLAGLVDALERRPPGLALGAEARLMVLGSPPARRLGGSRWAWELHGATDGALSPLDWDALRRLLAVVDELARTPGVLALHDVADGGLAVALAEMAAAGGVGLVASGGVDHIGWFAEGPGRVVVGCEPSRVATVRSLADDAGVAVAVAGEAGGDAFVLEGLCNLSVDRVVSAWQGRLAGALGHPNARRGRRERHRPR